MAQDPLNVLWIEPHFPGRLGAVADWLVRRRGYRCWFYCQTSSPRDQWPASVGQGLEVQTFNVGGIARESAVAWSRALERGLCYAFGCYEVLDVRRPRPIDLVIGRSSGLGSTLFSPVFCPSAPVVNLFDYYIQPHSNDLVEDDGPSAPPAYFHWRRSANVMDLLDLEQTSLAWTPTHWQRDLYPPEYRGDLWVQYDGVGVPKEESKPTSVERNGPRTLGGRSIPRGMRVVSFTASSLDRVRGFDRFWAAADVILRSRSDVLCIAVGDPIVRRGLDVNCHNQDYPARLGVERPQADPDRLWLLGSTSPSSVAEVLAVSDVHLAPGRNYPVARSLLEAMGAGCVVIASEIPPHREVLAGGKEGILVDPEDTEALARQALSVIADPVGHRTLGDAARERVRTDYALDACVPRIAERFSALAADRRGD